MHGAASNRFFIFFLIHLTCAFPTWFHFLFNGNKYSQHRFILSSYFRIITSMRFCILRQKLDNHKEKHRRNVEMFHFQCTQWDRETKAKKKRIWSELNLMIGLPHLLVTGCTQSNLVIRWGHYWNLDANKSVYRWQPLAIKWQHGKKRKNDARNSVTQ